VDLDRDGQLISLFNRRYMIDGHPVYVLFYITMLFGFVGPRHATQAILHHEHLLGRSHVL
jgi:hypothetical protein